MRMSEERPAVVENRRPTADDAPGVPGFRTWRGVYCFVLATFVAVVILLAIFTRVYS